MYTCEESDDENAIPCNIDEPGNCNIRSICAEGTNDNGEPGLYCGEYQGIPFSDEVSCDDDNPCEGLVKACQDDGVCGLTRDAEGKVSCDADVGQIDSKYTKRKVCMFGFQGSPSTCQTMEAEELQFIENPVYCQGDDDSDCKNYRSICQLQNYEGYSQYFCVAVNSEPQAGEITCGATMDCPGQSNYSPTNIQSTNKDRASYSWNVSEADLKQISSEPITIEIFQDLRCGMCKKNHNSAIIDALKNPHLKIKFREFPLGSRKEESKLAAAALCAQRQDKYPQFINEIYNNWDITSDNLSGLAIKIGLHTEQFEQCLHQPETMLSVKQDIAAGRILGVKGTPTYLINNKIFPGSRDYQSLLKLIMSAYEK